MRSLYPNTSGHDHKGHVPFFMFQIDRQNFKRPFRQFPPVMQPSGVDYQIY